jgi:hypothetical protein
MRTDIGTAVVPDPIQKETEMFKNRFLIVIGVSSLLLVTLAVSSPHVSTSPAPDQGASDFYQRHPEWWWRTTNQNVGIPLTSSSDDAFPDYYQRHPELTAPSILGLEASDYFQRHPELSAHVKRSVDTTDYFFRHLDDNTSASVISFSAEQIRREYILGERYGVTLQGYAGQPALREYWLGERYGQRP